MAVHLDLSSLKETRPQEYAVRFLFGGLCTGLAGLVARRYGPAVGGLFLAFPAIFPAAASLIQSHEKRRKAEIGKDGTERGREAAVLDSFGAAIGCLGLLSFACWVWYFATRWEPLYVLVVAFALWTGISVAGYLIHKHWPRTTHVH
jgi:hypothetical protein